MNSDSQDDTRPIKEIIDELFRQAVSLHHAEKYTDAIEVYHKILHLQPNHATVLYHLGLISAQTGHYNDAVNLFRRAIAIDANQPSFYYNLGKVLRILDKPNDAISCFHKVIEINPDFHDIHLHLAKALNDTRNLDDSIRHYRIFLSRYPDNADALINFGVTLREHGNLDASIDNIKKGLEIIPESSEGFNNLGNSFLEKGDNEDAITAFRKAISIDPNNVIAIYNLGITFQRLGNKPDAIDAFRRVLALQPDNVIAYRQLAISKTFTELDNDIQSMQVLLNKEGMSQSEKMILYFALGKAFENLKEYEKSFDYILTANKIRRSELSYDLDVDRKFINSLIDIFDQDFFNNRLSYGNDSDMPIFIVGMPRSGTTLIEQILANHPLIHGAGEINDIKNILLNENKKISANNFPGNAPQLEQHEVNGLADIYLARIRKLAAGHKRVTNKMPSNFLFIGMIRIMFPKAIIIHCTRNPADTCLSCFQNYFPNSQEFSYELTELGKYYNLYKKLMTHWHSVLPGYIYDINYEDLIADQKYWTRCLLQFCHLPWDDACLSFHDSTRPVKTLSIDQVRQPIYRSSINKWTHYKNQLAPLLAELAGQ